MEPTTVLKRPLITEKSTWESGARGRYSFVVDMRANKPQIRRAVESIYGVQVEKVSTLVRKGKYFRTKFGPARTSSWKKAVVELKGDDRIELF